MKIYIASDIHEQWDEFPVISQDYDLALISGDITNTGKPYAYDEAGQWLAGITKKGNIPCYYVPGNHDLNCQLDSIKYGTNILNKVVTLPDGRSIVGMSLSVCYNRPDLALTWDNMTSSYEKEVRYYDNMPQADIVLSHSPPQCRLGMAYTLQLGSKGLRDYIEKYEPELVICGHIHESPGSTMIRGTTVFNTARQYDIIDIPDNKG